MKEGYFPDSDIYTFSNLFFDCMYVVQSCCRWSIALIQCMYKYSKTNSVLFYIFLCIAITMCCIAVYFLQEEKYGNDILKHTQKIGEPPPIKLFGYWLSTNFLTSFETTHGWQIARIVPTLTIFWTDLIATSRTFSSKTFASTKNIHWKL